nr:RecX family transcriptional regulator [uncultured Marinobacter sp.]
MDLGYGPLRIQAELQQRGIQETPSCVREMNDTDWSDRATLLREKRFGLSDIRDDWDEKARQARFLARRGFSSEHVENALEQRL